ncbi:glycosyltransferase family 2 protein [Stenotrophomonas sp. SI-NJAU-1]|uniref:glycosyltransferase family 2 protein n=1 Tax=Stenotrophomonas TaxID=40323 RepID=UPI001E606321|nr:MULTISPECIES: glycosyltransferase family 2 protein [Stenotrophomonas]MDN8643857.1 glycosyltransferase family 2 protein [Stenotrophomonas indicatrix]MDN8657023.1 glycosyltransferase family 2 protein [Stenotrophomonas indicatrix]UEX18759.1 glycosyltransferase family 2 protein [Stenotrophomonas sp. SI-NJAU-1]
MKPELSIVIPVYGSASILPSLVRRLEEVLVPALGADGFEVVLVHDSGPDNAWEVIRSEARTRPWLVGVDLRRNAGQHNAIMAGLGFARGRYIVTMDDDLQHDPADVPRILQTLRDGADLCYVQFEGRKHALWKRAGSRFNDMVAARLLKKPEGLYLSPFRGFVRELGEEARRYQGPFVYLDGLLVQSTSPKRIATITGQHHARSDGRSGYSLSKSISLWLQMATSFSIVPLRFVSLAGVLASCVAFLLAVVVLWQKLHSPQMAVGWPSLIITILFMGGLQLLALGVIGEYTGRVLLNINNRPQYIIGRTTNVAGRDEDDRP